MDVGVRELKQRLSEYLRRAANGETVRVTDRGVPKAVLGPLPGQPRLQEGISDGWITAAEERPIPRVRRVRSRRRIADVVGEDRNG